MSKLSKVDIVSKLSYEQGRADAFASLAIGVASTEEGATVVVMSKDKETGVITVMANAMVKNWQDGYITLG